MMMTAASSSTTGTCSIHSHVGTNNQNQNQKHRNQLLIEGGAFSKGRMTNSTLCQSTSSQSERNVRPRNGRYFSTTTTAAAVSTSASAVGDNKSLPRQQPPRRRKKGPGGHPKYANVGVKEPHVADTAEEMLDNLKIDYADGEDDGQVNVSSRTNFEASTTAGSASSNTNMNHAFTPRKADGSEFDSFDDYLASVPLSPWVPTPDPVARRMLQLTNMSNDDVHFELGCGDGRLNFMAHDMFAPKRSVGIDIDSQWIDICNQKIQQRHPIPRNHIQFLQADVEALLKEPSAGFFLKDCTVLTMYFVEEGLLKIKPYLEQHLWGSGCRIVTNGYAMPGWEPDWVEVCLGLKMYLYVLGPDKEITVATGTVGNHQDDEEEKEQR
jgi:hypothetical protein